MKHLREKWLAPGGEIVCAATSRDGRNIELRSESIIYLTHNYLENHELFTPLISHICRSINSSLPELPMEDTGAVMHFQLQTTDSEAIAVFLHEKMNREACASPETLITGESEAQLREIEAILREKYRWETTTTFARDKVLESLIRNTRNTRGALDLQNDSRRHRFWARREQLKMAMPGELTGFHMPCVVLLHRRSLPPDYRHLYRAVTRATRLLMIVSFP